MSKTLTDVGKGLLLAAMVGWSTGTLRWWVALSGILGAAVALARAYRLEGRQDDAAQ